MASSLSPGPVGSRALLSFGRWNLKVQRIKGVCMCMVMNGDPSPFHLQCCYDTYM